MAKISLILLVIGLSLSLGIFGFGIWWTATFDNGPNPSPHPFPVPVSYVPVLMNLGYVLIEAGAILFLVGVVLSKETKQARANGNAH
jgi:hypothetical protein